MSAHSLLDTLCPMHVEINHTGHIVHAGPTMVKILGKDIVGQRFLELFELRRPRVITSVAKLRADAGTTLHLRMRTDDGIGLKGVAMPNPGSDHLVVNLSFGMSVIEAVRQYTLTSADFAATDLAIEMLYLVEAKSAAMDASRKLNQRLQGAMIAAEEQAFTDTLTGLKNRRALDYILARTLEYRNTFCLMHVDLDYFKSVNDTLGHAAGDQVLLRVARVLVELTRDQDTIARVGGDEFVLVFHNDMDDLALADIASRLIARLEEPIPVGDQVAKISASIGIVPSRNYPDLDIARMFEDADVALYASKHAGRGCFTFYKPELRESGVLHGLGGVA